MSPFMWFGIVAVICGIACVLWLIARQNGDDL